MFAKVDVNGDNEAPLYSMLKAQQAGDGENADICLLYTSPSPRDS